MIKSLQSKGYAIIDNLLTPHDAELLRAEVLAAKSEHRLAPANIGGGKHSASLRGDLMGWFRATDYGLSNLSSWLEAADGEPANCLCTCCAV